MNDLKGSNECVVIEFPENDDPIEVKTRANTNLPLLLMGWAAIWANLTRPETNTYRLSSPSPTQEFPVIKYINNEWYYLYWDKGSYYTKQ